MTTTKLNSWSHAEFEFRNGSCKQQIISVSGRDRWALECLISTGTNGCTPITTPGPRWSGYVFNLRALGVEIETRTKRHGGPFSGTHANYVLRSNVTRKNNEVKA